jgi:hypothetical protein
MDGRTFDEQVGAVLVVQPLLLAAGRAPDELVGEVRVHAAALVQAWHPVTRAFAAVVATTPHVGPPPRGLS